MVEIVRVESRDRAPGAQIGIACELRRKLDRAVPEPTMDGGPRIRAGLGDPGLSDLHHPAYFNSLPVAGDGPSPTARPPASTPCASCASPN